MPDGGMLEATTDESREFTALARRNCSIAPIPLCLATGLSAAVAVLIAAGWAVAGAWVILPFAGLEAMALGVALVIYARRVGDYERISLIGERLLVEVRDGDELRRHEFNRAWVRIVTGHGGRGRVAVGYHGREVEIGRQLAEGERRRLVQELRRRLLPARV